MFIPLEKVHYPGTPPPANDMKRSGQEAMVPLLELFRKALREIKADAELKRIPLTGAGESGLVNRYIISKGLDRQLVIYWYQSNGRIVASEYWAKVYLVADSIRRNRSDGALVRIVTPIVRDETVESAEERALSFVRLSLPNLDKIIPR